MAPDRPEVLLQEHPGRRLRAAHRGAADGRGRAADGLGGRRGQDRASRGTGKENQVVVNHGSEHIFEVLETIWPGSRS